MATRRVSVEIVGTSASLERAFGRSTKSAQGFNTAMHGLIGTSGGFSRGFLSGAGALSSFGGALALTSGSFFAGAGIVTALKASVDAAGDFQQTLNVLKQVSGATGRELAAAAAEARKLGADISLPATSATDAAHAMLALSKGGLTVTQAMHAARGTLQLAAAAQTDVGTAANTTARALTAFGLSGDQAGKIADALANGANAATGDITDFAIGLSQSATSAHQFGLTAQQTVAALTELARAGLVGSDAGTSLRVMLSRLLPTAHKAREEIKALGVNVTDAKGNFLPFRDIVDQYSTALGKLTPKQKQFALQTIFGTDAQRSANIILGGGVKLYDQLSTAVDKQGGAAKAAAAQQKGFKGAVDGFNSALQTTEVTIGTTLLPTLTQYLHQSAKWLSDSHNQARIQADVKTAVHDTVTVVKDLVSGVKTVTGVFGGLKNTLELLIGLKIASTLAGWAKGIAAIEVASGVGAAGSNGGGAIKGVTTIGSEIRKLARIGTLAVGLRFPALGDNLSKLTSLRALLLSVKQIGIVAVGVAVTYTIATKILNSTGGAKLLNRFGATVASGGLLAKQKTNNAGTSGDIQAAIADARKAILNGDDVKKSFAGLGLNISDNETQAIIRIATSEARSAGAAGGQAVEAAVKASFGTAFSVAAAKEAAKPATGDAVATLHPFTISIAKLNTFFDNSIARILLRGGLGSVSEQLSALEKASALLSKRIDATKDVTRKLNLEDQLLQIGAQEKQLRQQQGSDFIAALQLGLARAQTTSTLTDDIAALRKIQDGLKAQIREFGKTTDLENQLLDAQQQLKDTLQKQRDAKQFSTLGLTSTGDVRTPLVTTLKKELSNVSDAVSGTFLDTKKTQSVLSNIKKVLSAGIGGVSTEVRAKIKEMLDGIDKQLKDHTGNLTKFSHVNASALLAGLGLSPEQMRAARERISQLGPNGTIPGQGSAAFAGAGATTLHSTVSVNLDGRQVGKAVTTRQIKHNKKRTLPRGA